MKSLPSTNEPQESLNFRKLFLKILDHHYHQEPLIADILKDKALSAACANLMRPCADDSPAELVKLHNRYQKYWDTKLNDAIRGVLAAQEIYRKLDPNPEYAQLNARVGVDLLEKQQKRAQQPSFQSKWLGRDRDWNLVQLAKDNLESLLRARQSIPKSTLRRGLPSRTLAALLNAALEAKGLEGKYSPEAVRVGLVRRKKRKIPS